MINKVWELLVDLQATLTEHHETVNALESSNICFLDVRIVIEAELTSSETLGNGRFYFWRANFLVFQVKLDSSEILSREPVLRSTLVTPQKPSGKSFVLVQNHRDSSHLVAAVGAKLMLALCHLYQRHWASHAKGALSLHYYMRLHCRLLGAFFFRLLLLIFGFYVLQKQT